MPACRFGMMEGAVLKDPKQSLRRAIAQPTAGGESVTKEDVGKIPREREDP